MARSLAGAAPGRTNRRFLILAIAFAGLSAGLIYAWMASSGGGNDESTGAAGARQVVVAKAPIAPRTAITAEMLEIKSLPANAIVDGGYTTVDDVVGKVTKLPLEANQQVTASTVVDTSAPTDEALSLVVPNGRRAFSINASQVLTAGGLLLPGDYVDIVWICCEQGVQLGPDPDEKTSDTVFFARTIVQNVQVAAVAQAIVQSGPVGSGDGGGQNPVPSGASDENPEAATITLLVSTEQAHILFMAESTGQLRAALRGIDDEQALAPNEDHTFTTPGLIPPELLAQLREMFTIGQ
jgi:pilus assembly protein CpaB